MGYGVEGERVMNRQEAIIELKAIKDFYGDGGCDGSCDEICQEGR